MPFTIPAPVTAEMRPLLKAFNSRSDSMNQWLRQWCLFNEEEGFSRTYVSFCTETGRLAGYYTLSNFAILTKDVQPEHLLRRSPPMIPCMLLGRLAVDQAFEKQGLGKALVKNAVRHTLQSSVTSGIWALVVHPSTPSLVGFYSSLNFRVSTNNDSLMMYYVLRSKKAKA